MKIFIIVFIIVQIIVAYYDRSGNNRSVTIEDFSNFKNQCNSKILSFQNKSTIDILNLKSEYNNFRNDF